MRGTSRSTPQDESFRVERGRRMKNIEIKVKVIGAADVAVAQRELQVGQDDRSGQSRRCHRCGIVCSDQRSH